MLQRFGILPTLRRARLAVTGKITLYNNQTDDEPPAGIKVDGNTVGGNLTSLGNFPAPTWLRHRQVGPGENQQRADCGDRDQGKQRGGIFGEANREHEQDSPKMMGASYTMVAWTEQPGTSGQRRSQ
jgi:hypothetical protein